jgi:NTE family protein
LLGANLEAQTDAFTRATMEAVVLDQDFGGYGSELRSTVKLGYETELGSEYFRPLFPLAPPQHTIFAAPRIGFLREPFPVFVDNVQIANRQFQSFSTGGDIGWTNQRTQQLRVGYDFAQIHWVTTIGNDGQPDFSGQSERARLRYDYDTQDRALVPQFGVHLTGEAGYLFSTVGSPNAPELFAKFSYAHRFSLHKAPHTDAPKDPNRGHEVFVVASEGGTMFDKDVAAPFRFTLGGPVRLSASAIDQYRGTDYFLIEPAILRRIAQLPQPLGQSIYFGVGLEAGQMHAPGMPTITREDGFFGIVAETPLGVITLAPAIGSNGERKLVFTLGKLF